MDYAIDLKPYYEPIAIKSILNDSIVEHAGRQYRAERWFKNYGHAFVLIDISDLPPKAKPFPKRSSELKEAIQTNKIKVIKL